MEMKNMLFETREKMVLIVKWQGYTELYCNVQWEARLASDEIGYLAKEIFKQIVEGVTWLS